MIPSGVQKAFIIGKETSWGVAASANAGKKMRRVTATLNLKKKTYESAELRSDQQVVDYRHGMRSVEGSLDGELSCKSYQDIWAALFRAAWAAGATTGAVITIAAGNANGVYTRSSGSYVTDGFKVGDLVLISGFATGANNGQFVITALSATVMTTTNSASVTEAAGASVTILVDGKKLQVPSTGHTQDSFTIEQLFEMGATDVSEQATGVKPTSFTISVQPDGMTEVSFGLLGKDMTSDNTSYFTTPTAEDTTGVMSGSVGAIYLDGVAIAVVTSLTINGEMGAEVGQVVGNSTPADVFMGRFRVTGEMQAYFLDNALWTSYSNESELSLVVRLNAGTDQVMVMNLPRIKLGGTDKDDKEVGGIVQTVPFQALKYIGSGNYDATTMVLQDTEAV
jgi:hypothetical protein